MFLVCCKVVSSPQGQTRTCRIAEVHFSDMKALEDCLRSDGCKEVLEHAKSISTGGTPIIFVCQEENYVFW